VPHEGGGIANLSLARICAHRRREFRILFEGRFWPALRLHSGGKASLPVLIIVTRSRLSQREGAGGHGGPSCSASLHTGGRLALVRELNMTFLFRGDYEVPVKEPWWTLSRHDQKLTARASVFWGVSWVATMRRVQQHETTSGVQAAGRPTFDTWNSCPS
jgi:hypothetical protein